MRQFIIKGIVIVVLSLISQGADHPTVKEMHEAVNKLREFVPRLAEQEGHFSRYNMSLLGLAHIYERYGPAQIYWDRVEYLYRKALKLEPNNKVINSSLSKWFVGNFLSHRGCLSNDLEMKKKGSMSKNLKEVEVTSGEDLFEWLHEEGQERVVIRDFNEARARIFEKIDRGLPDVISEVEKSEKYDPNNAIYNYLRAQLNFEIGKDEDGIKEVEIGSKKPYLENYWLHISAARNGVLRDAGFPENYREIIEKSQVYIGGLPNYEKMLEIAKQKETRQDFKKAAQIYELLIRMADQVRQEPVPGGPDGKRGKIDFSDRIEKEAKLQLSNIQSRIKNEETK